MEELRRTALRLHPELRDKSIFWKRKTSVLKVGLCVGAWVRWAVAYSLLCARACSPALVQQCLPAPAPAHRAPTLPQHPHTPPHPSGAHAAAGLPRSRASPAR